MIIVGIDMSKNSPGVCVRENDNLSFLSFIRDKEKKSNKSFYDELKSLDVKVIMNDRTTEIKDYNELEKWKIKDASMLANTIISNLPIDIDILGIEGFSYGSKGNAGLDIAGYSYCLRKTIFEKFGEDKFNVFSPGSVKKNAGKGNAGKEEMLDFFINTTDETLKQTKFWKALYENKLNYKKSPISDLIDSYYVQECARIHKNLI